MDSAIALKHARKPSAVTENCSNAKARIAQTMTRIAVLLLFAGPYENIFSTAASTTVTGSSMIGIFTPQESNRIQTGSHAPIHVAMVRVAKSRPWNRFLR